MEYSYVPLLLSLPTKVWAKECDKNICCLSATFNTKWSVIISLTLSQQLLHSVQSFGILLSHQLVESGIRTSKNFLPSPVNQTGWAYMIEGCASFESQMFREKTSL